MSFIKPYLYLMILTYKMMEEISIVHKSKVNRTKEVRTNLNGNKLTPEGTGTNPGLDNLITEGGENFFHYLRRLGLANEPNLLVLPKKHHYYYDYNELKGVTTIINLKKLNLIGHLDRFLHDVCQALSPNTNFIGCFSDSKTQTEVALLAKMYKRFINFLDSKTDSEIDKKGVSRLLESQGFKVIDMTDINGVTYFSTRNKRRSVE